MGGADENGIILLPVPQIVKVNPYGAGRDKGIIKPVSYTHLEAWLDAEFEGGRHERRVNMIMDIENS